MAATDLEPELFNEDRRYWIVGPTYDLGEKEFRYVWDDLIISQKLGQHKRTKKAYNKKGGDMYIEFPWGTRLEVRSADHPENLVGEGLHGCIMSEAAKHRPDTWERYIRPALADYRGWGSFPTTPEGQNWLYKLWQLGKNPNFEDYEAWRFPSWENPHLYPGGRQDKEILLLEGTTEPEWFAQEIGADFTAFVGKIYGEFDEDKHVREVKFNPDLPSYIAFDWGFTNPLAAIEFQIDAWDRVHIWREHYKPYQILEDHIADMEARPQPPGYHLDMAFGDAADPEAAAYVSRSMVACYAEPEAKKNWREGVDLVKQFLKSYPTGDYDEHERPIEEPHLFIDHSCANVIREFNNYKAKPPPTTKGGRQSNPREDAQKYDDHALDAIRYALMHLYKLGAQHSLAEVYTGPDKKSETNSPRGDLQLTAPSGGFMTLDKEF